MFSGMGNEALYSMGLVKLPLFAKKKKKKFLSCSIQDEVIFFSPSRTQLKLLYCD